MNAVLLAGIIAAVGGVLAVAANGMPADLGRIAFGAGLLAMLMRWH